jgi:site-specific DNA-methyltransferase (adenine-specific)
MTQFITMTQMATTLNVTRGEMATMLRRAGLVTPAHKPSEKAVTQRFCKLIHAGDLVVWHQQKAIAAIKYAGDWSTPDWLFQALDAEFRFTLDAAASPHNAKCKRFFTEEEDGLAQDWGTEKVWCNPPFSARVISAWARKAYEASRGGAIVVLLMPLWTAYGWFDEYCVVHGQIRQVVGKVYFRGASGQAAGKYCVVVVFGPGIQGYTNGPSIRKPKSGRRA